MAWGPGGGRILDLGASVRSNTGGAALAAGLLIFFGFFYLAEPVGDVGLSLLYYALRYGGLAMVGVSVWLSFGHLPALAADAAVSVVVGGLIALSGAFMLIGDFSWVEGLVVLVSGGTFLTGGLRNGRDFVEMWRIEMADDSDNEEEDIAALSASKDSPLAADLARGEALPKAKPRPRNDPDLVDMQPTSPPQDATAAGADRPVQLDGLSPGPPPTKGPGPSSGPSESYLAKLAKKDKSADR